MYPVAPSTILLTVESLILATIVALIVIRRTLQERTVPLLLLYAVLAAAWVLGQVIVSLGRSDGWWVEPTIQRIALYGTFVLSVVLLVLSRSLLLVQRPAWPWWAAGLIWLGTLVALDITAMTWSVEVLPGLQLDLVVLVLFGLGILVCNVLCWIWIVRSRAQAHPLHRNRVSYWPVVLLLSAAGSAIVLAGQYRLGMAIQALSAPVAAYVVLTRRLPGVRQSARWLLGYLIAAVLTVVLYAGGAIGIQSVFHDLPAHGALIANTCLALLLALFFHPLRTLVQRLIVRLIPGRGYDPVRTLDEYGDRVGNVIDLGSLAEIVSAVTGEVLQVDRVALLIVRAQDPEGTELSLYGVGSQDTPPLPQDSLSAESPIVHFFLEERRPITLYEVNLLPALRDAPDSERRWLIDLGMEVYVPICSQDEWLGLLALGAKRAPDRYIAEDLDLLRTLAEQTAVPLENARLVEDMRQYCTDLHRAYTTLTQNHDQLEQTYTNLESTNSGLQESDWLKSRFVRAVTHELRIPFANVDLALQLIERHGTDNWVPDQTEQLRQIKADVGQARQMVDNLVTFATLVSREEETVKEDIVLADLIAAALRPLEAQVADKNIELEIALPADLPPVPGERERLGDAIYQLTHNAIQYTPEGGSIWIHSRLENQILYLEVQDTGPGIPADQLDALQRQFAGAAGPTSGGMGLGLAIVHMIVDAHGGKVYVQSEWESGDVEIGDKRGGSAFGFCLPMVGDRVEDLILPAPEDEDPEQATNELKPTPESEEDEP